MSKFIKGPYRYVECTRPISGAVYYDVLTDSGEMFEDVLCAAELEANARLFAAAPELYEALEAICQMQERNYGDATQTHMDLSELSKKAKIILTKARGKV